MKRSRAFQRESREGNCTGSSTMELIKEHASPVAAEDERRGKEVLRRRDGFTQFTPGALFDGLPSLRGEKARQGKPASAGRKQCRANERGRERMQQRPTASCSVNGKNRATNGKVFLPLGRQGLFETAGKSRRLRPRVGLRNLGRDDGDDAAMGMQNGDSSMT